MSDQEVVHIDCTEAARRLWAYLDGELDAPSAAEIEAHLAWCAKCLRLSQSQREFLGLLHDDRTPVGLEAQANALRVKVQQRIAEERARTGTVG